MRDFGLFLERAVKVFLKRDFLACVLPSRYILVSGGFGVHQSVFIRGLCGGVRLARPLPKNL